MDNRGTLYLWAVAALTIICLSFFWFVLTWPATMTIEAVESQYTFPSNTQLYIKIIKAIVGYFLVLVVIGVTLWISVNSQRRERDVI